MMRMFQSLSMSISLLFFVGCVAPGTVLKSTQKRGQPVIETVSADPVFLLGTPVVLKSEIHVTGQLQPRCTKIVKTPVILVDTKAGEGFMAEPVVEESVLRTDTNQTVINCETLRPAKGRKLFIRLDPPQETLFSVELGDNGQSVIPLAQIGQEKMVMELAGKGALRSAKITILDSANPSQPLQTVDFEGLIGRKGLVKASRMNEAILEEKRIEAERKRLAEEAERRRIAEEQERRRRAEAEARAREARQYREWAESYAWDAIRKRLRDPSSAVMRSIELDERTGDTDFLFFITVQARNGFGGYGVEEWYAGVRVVPGEKGSYYTCNLGGFVDNPSPLGNDTYSAKRMVRQFFAKGLCRN